MKISKTLIKIDRIEAESELQKISGGSPIPFFITYTLNKWGEKLNEIIHNYFKKQL